MAAPGTSVAALLQAFLAELLELRQLDAKSQAAFSAGRPRTLSVDQLHILVETVFFRALRGLELYTRDIFLLYCTGHASMSGQAVTSFLRPRDSAHAEQMVRSSMPFLDWGSPDEVIKRAELYLDRGFPMKVPFSTRVAVLRDYRHVRNQIAHASAESLSHYLKALGRYYGAPPLPVPQPGAFLLQPDRAQRTKYQLQVMLDTLEALAKDVAA